MFKDNLLYIQNQLKNYHREKEKLLPYYFEERLKNSLKSYDKELASLINENRKKEEAKEYYPKERVLTQPKIRPTKVYK